MIGFRKQMDFFNMLIQISENTLKAAHTYRQAVMEGSFPIQFIEEMKELETKGDLLTHEMLKHLMDKSYSVPIQREDIMSLALKMDDIIDGLEAVMARYDYLNINLSDQWMQSFSEVLVGCCEHLLAAFKLLASRKFLQIREHTILVNDLENEGDRLMREGIRHIFTHPKDPYHDFKLKEIYERLEQTTDACEDVADILESIILRYA